MEELWVPIKGYPNYEISSMGRVKRLKHTSLKTSYNGQMYMCFYDDKIYDTFNEKGIKGKGYYRITLFDNYKGRSHLVHRLVAEAFIPNPDNKSEVDHIDRDTHNNNVSNLRWVTHYENMINTSRK